MLRFLRNIHPAREFKAEDVHDYFRYAPTLRHGFPQNVSAIAHDPLLGLLAIGTKDGHIRVFGAENVEWSSTTPRNTSVAHIFFAAGLGAIIALCSDQSFHKFILSGDSIERNSASHEERLKRITCCEMQNDDERSDARLLIGTVTGNIFALYVVTLELSELVLFEETVWRSVAPLNGDARSVSDVAVNPKDSSKVLIVFNNAVIVHYDLESNRVILFWEAIQSITSVAWNVEGEQFLCSHCDGSLDTWASNREEPVEASHIPFGPFPCTSVTKVRWACGASHPSAVKFYSGGMPRASYGDRYTLSAMRPGKHVVFDFGSPIVDFILVPSLHSGRADFSNTLALMVLCEQELVCIDLSDTNWPVIESPYLLPIHCSQITCNIHCSNIEDFVWKGILKASEGQKKKIISKGKWPIVAGANVQAPSPCAANNSQKKQLIITGHENGMVKFWSAGSVNLRHLLTIDTAKEFEGCFSVEEVERDARNENDSDDELNGSSDWPPFRKVGTYDPFCDDPRLSVQKLFFDSATGQLVVGGRAGHVIVYNLEDEPSAAVKLRKISFEAIELSKLSGKGATQQPLPPRRLPVSYPIGYQPFKLEDSQSCFVQLLPSTAVTAVASQPKRDLLAVGCEYGFILCDMRAQTVLIRNCLMKADELLEAAALAGALSRFKSMKKSIRQSFRRKKRHPQSAEQGCSSSQQEAHEVKPVERQIASRSEAPLNAGDPLSSTVRVLKFCSANLLSSTFTTDTLWIGTNGGVVLAYAITDEALRPEDVCVLVKEVHFQHRAPVIDFDCVTTEGSPVAKEIPSGQRMVVYTEEQIKALSLPTMKPTRFKFKLTSVEGSRIRKAQLLTLRSSSNKNMSERFLAVVTNQGELFLFSAVGLKRYLKVNFTKATDVIGIGSAMLSTYGELFFLRPGGSEFQRASLAAVQHTNLLSPLKDNDFPPVAQ